MDPFNAYGIGRQHNRCSACPKWRPGQLPRIPYDADFGELAVFYGKPHSGIIRLVNIGARQQAPACLRVVDLHEEDLKSGAIITAEPNRLRIRSAAIEEE